jgi:hypothetical protein
MQPRLIGLTRDALEVVQRSHDGRKRIEWLHYKDAPPGRLGEGDVTKPRHRNPWGPPGRRRGGPGTCGAAKAGETVRNTLSICGQPGARWARITGDPPQTGAEILGVELQPESFATMRVTRTFRP